MDIRGSIGRFSFYAAVAVLAGSFLFVTVFRGIRNSSRNNSSLILTASHAPSSANSADKSASLRAFGSLPLSFTENQGQLAQEVRYSTHGAQYDLFLTPQEAVVALRRSQHFDLSPRHRGASLKALHALRHASGSTTTAALHLRFEGANPAPQVTGAEQLPGKVNYFIGNDPQKWHTDVPTYAQVKYNQLYPGVDLLFYGRQRTLEYDFVVAPGADPSVIAMKLSGERHLRLNAHGDVVVSVPDGQVMLHKPVVYQNIAGERKEIAGNYSLRGDHLSFAIGSYDRSAPLIVDPVFDYGTYLGGTNDDGSGNAVAIDASGDAFIVGQTFSSDFPPSSALTPGANTANGTGFLVELNPGGTALLYSTYLGASAGGDLPFGVAVSGGDVYVTGETFGTDFPSGTISGFKPSITTNANGVGFLAKIDPTKSGAASLLYSSYIGGGAGSVIGDFGNAVAADAAGNAYVTGVTFSSEGTGDDNFQTTSNAFQSALVDTAGSAFLTRVDTTQSGTSSLVYSTYLGGDGALSVNTNLEFGDGGFGVVVDSANKAYMVGTTSSSSAGPFPVSAHPFQSAPLAANIWSSVFISEIDTTQSGANSLVYSTYLGGSGDSNAGLGDSGAAIDLKSGSTVVYVTGSTNSPDFPLQNGFQTTGDANVGSAFVTLLDTSAGTTLKYSTYLSNNDTSGNGIKVDSSTGNAYVAGGTASIGFATPGAFQGALASGAPGDAFVAEISPLGAGAADLVYFTYFGGSGAVDAPDQAFGLALGTAPTVFITGPTSSTNLPVTDGAFQNTLGTGSSSEAFAASITLQPIFSVSPTSLTFGSPLHVTSAAQTVMLTNNTGGGVAYTTPTVTNPSPAAAATDFAVSATTCPAIIASGANCTVSVTYTPSGSAAETGTLSIADGVGAAPHTVALSGTTLTSFTVAPTSLTFTSSAVGTATAPQSVTLTNNTSAAVTFTSAQISENVGTTDFALQPATTCGATIAANGGSCVISVTFTPSVTTTETGTLTITDGAGVQDVTLTGNVTAATPGFTLGATNTMLMVTKGASVTDAITVTSVGGFTGAVALACTGQPNRSTCMIAPSSVTPTAGGTATAMLTFATKALVAPPPSTPVLPPGSIKVVAPIALALLLIILLASEQRLRTRLAMAGALLVFVALSGCAQSGTAPGTYTLTVTGTATGAASQTETITVIVAPK
ncbi:MAG: choice-of-anchor D domain-containing protein [Candidatus Acidiferrum sp.]